MLLLQQENYITTEFPPFASPWKQHCAHFGTFVGRKGRRIWDPSNPEPLGSNPSWILWILSLS